MKKINYLGLPATYRLLVISDIHGHLGLFKELLAKANFSENDYLIINGDLIEKGPDSYGVVKEVMKMAQTNPKVFVIEGNCDPLCEDLNDNPDELIPYLKQRSASLLNEWLTLQGTSIETINDGQTLVELLATPYADEIAWLTQLPTAIETKDFIFVHAGIADQADWQKTERIDALTMPRFYQRQHQAQQFVVVGHYPVANYTPNTQPPNHTIKFDERNRIISIDGGNQLKRDGQLNALIINSHDHQLSFDQLAVDSLPKHVIKEDFQPMQLVPAGNLHYPDYYVRVLKKGNDFSLCRNLNNEAELWLKNEHLKTDELGTYVITDTTSYQLAVSKGELVSVIETSSQNFSLIKKNGMSGWIPSSLLSDQTN